MPALARSLTVEYGPHSSVIDVSRPRFSWVMEDDRPGARQSAYHLQVSALARGVAMPQPAADQPLPDPLWDSGEVESDDSVFVHYRGPELESLSSYVVRLRIRDHGHEWGAWSDPVRFETGFLNNEWSASWIAPDDEAGETAAPCPYLRSGFTLDAPPVAARLYASARGLMELSLNGSRVSDDVLSPGWTDYESRAQYVTYDVTALLREGPNTIGAILGDGWYSGRIARVRDDRRRFGDRPQLLCELHITTDAGTMIVSSDESWTWATGPIVASDIYDGEDYDARLEMPEWDSSPADQATTRANGEVTRRDGTPAGFRPVRVVGHAGSGWRGKDDESEPALDAKINPPVRRVQEIAAVAQTEPEPGAYVYDLGQNISGWTRVRLSGTAGEKITLRFAEMLQADGTLYVENLRSARATDTYVPAADGEFTWEPRFTFHGFRYVEVRGIGSAPALEQIVGLVLHNDMEKTGEFQSSSDLVNQLQSNIQWGQRGNYLEAPTDCPQRDERLGWTGDAQVFIPTGAFNYNVDSFFVKWQRDLVDSQGPEGTIPSVAPAIRYMAPEDANDGGPAWSDAFVICPWVVYQKYGDVRILEESYPQMRRFVTSMERRSRGLIRSDEFVMDWGGFGDWVSMDAPQGGTIGATPKDLIGTGYFAHTTKLLARIAGILGRERDQRELRDLHRRITAAFQAEYVTPSGRVLGDTQTAYVVALAFDMLPPDLRQQAVDRLVRKLEHRGWRLDTGFVGTASLCGVLSRFGRTDVAYRLLLQEEYPSWLYTVNQGATTMWERWNSYTHEHGFGPVSMNSFNHYAYGAIGDWMYTVAAGLRVDLSEPGEPPIRIEPAPGYGFTHASAELRTPYGIASSSWTLGGDNDRRVTLNVRVPANARARLEINAGASDIEIDAEAGEEQLEELVVHEGMDGGRFTFLVAAGSFSFSWLLPEQASLDAGGRNGLFGTL